MSTRYGLDFEMQIIDKSKAEEIKSFIENSWTIESWTSWEEKEHGIHIICGYAEAEISSSFGCEYEERLKVFHENIEKIHGTRLNARWTVVFVEQAPYETVEFGPDTEDEPADDASDFAVPV